MLYGIILGHKYNNERLDPMFPHVSNGTVLYGIILGHKYNNERLDTMFPLFSVINIITKDLTPCFQEQLVTRDYLDLKFQQELSPVKIDLAVLKWMMGLLLGGMLSLIINAYL